MVEAPIGWLIREMRGPNRDQLSVMTGYMFRSREAAEAAALRLSNRWRTCAAFPVFNPTAEQLEWTG